MTGLTGGACHAWCLLPVASWLQCINLVSINDCLARGLPVPGLMSQPKYSLADNSQGEQTLQTLQTLQTSQSSEPCKEGDGEMESEGPAVTVNWEREVDTVFMDEIRKFFMMCQCQCTAVN